MLATSVQIMWTENQIPGKFVLPPTRKTFFVFGQMDATPETQEMEGRATYYSTNQNFSHSQSLLINSVSVLAAFHFYK